jgi:protein gp37
MTDLFGEWVPPNQVADNILATQWCADDGLVIGPYDATYIWLTKRVTRMCSAIDNCGLNCGGLETHFFGFTAENQEWYEKRMSIVNERFPKWANLWMSAEPLLGPIDFRWDDVVIKPKVVITGCESGPKRRPCKIEWVESIVEQCRTAGVPVFVKQICLSNGKFTNKIEEFPKHLQIRQVPWAKEEK